MKSRDKKKIVAEMKKEGWLPADRRPIQPGALTECFVCQTELRSGSAYKVRNPVTLDVRQLGPSCFTKVTGQKPSAAPIIGIYNTRAHGVVAAEHAQRHYKRTNIDMPKARNKDARSIVTLRTMTLYVAGFDHMREGDLYRYRAASDVDRLSETDICAILSYDEREARYDRRHGLKQLQACETIDTQIKSLLHPERFPQDVMRHLRHFQDQLHEYHVLICDDMAQLQQWAKEGEAKYGVKNGIKTLAQDVKVHSYEPLCFPPEHRQPRRRAASNGGQEILPQANLGMVLLPNGLDPMR